jgi:formylglycine-generating enzyme required for sulfatase activity
VQAAAACENAGKRLCTNTEWLRACRTENVWSYPYGPSVVQGACNDTRAVHPAQELFPGDPDAFSKIDNACLNQLDDTVARAGTYAACVSAEGVHDMVGNLNEWTSDPAGTLRGGYYVNATINGTGCSYATTAHDVNHRDFSTGFRCCAD